MTYADAALTGASARAKWAGLVEGPASCAVTRTDALNGTGKWSTQLPSEPPFPVSRVCHGHPSSRSIPQPSTLGGVQLTAGSE
eukprot:CAMPEP_0206316448 /NCGR_PEP_ID=MMETSP0106_2-20121207/16102_1 /ASSEMBLY_ACC=CAM_ASM_000206 /TAXON_ID=81532 /ORGANISM="Acanthoeca-like sp., Strain 10tr" /LENGTH=82 /DNA_ID=CAMNT_0053747963 /DNA_START=181 /DNA_END=429 /DNA_ORIENTATION=+